MTKRPIPPKPLTRSGYLSSDAVLRAKEQGGFSKSHSAVLSKVLRNWMSLSPQSVATFEAAHLRFRNEIDSLSQAITRDGKIYRPTGYGLALMVALSIDGSTRFALDCAKTYAMLRMVYLKNPEHPEIASSDLQQELGLDDSRFEKVLQILSDIGAGHQTTGDAPRRVFAAQSIRDNADIWAVFEMMMSSYAKPASMTGGWDWPPVSHLMNSPLHEVPSIISMCPSALEDWKKAHERLMRDPAGAITSARSMLESTIKWIHHQKQVPPPSNDGSTGRKLKECFRLLGGEDNDFEKPGIKLMVSGMETAANGLDFARNAMGDGHGKAPDAPPANSRIARLAVSMATAVTTFLLATYESRQRP